MKMFPIFEHAPVIVCSCILGLLLSPPTAHAEQANRFVDESVQAPIRETLTLEDTIRMTLANNPSLYEFEFKQRVIDGESKTAALKPALSAGVELENLLGTGEVSGIKELEVTLTLSSVLQLNDKPAARLNVLSERRIQQDVEKQIRTLDILGELNRRYIKVLVLQASLEVIKDAETLALYTLNAVTKRVEAGASPLLEQKRAQAALAQAKLDVSLAQQDLRFGLRSLSIMWGEQTPSFKRVEGDLFAFNKIASFDALAVAIQSGPHINLFAKQSRVQAAQLRLAQANNLADIEWSAGLRRMQGIDETALVAGISVSLFQKERNLGEYEAHRARLDAIELQKQSNLRSLLHSVNQALGEHTRALLEVETIQLNVIPPLKEALDLVESAYLEGRFSYLEWVTTRQEFLTTRLTLIEAASQVHLSKTEIETLTGLALKTEHNDDSMHSSHQDNLQQSSNISIRSHDYE
ncbi:outer membrane efflux protein [Alteromonas mediterranea MED64]|jgi:cobalt-zinc-cadmium efflux system outer membrane protein|uniref:TolC family protein n=1 Tax=Alteromonas mediterranea TaxID=314275 RepID=UPI0003556022|nr:TolC family protein [Alteromonas mediterranea]AGP83580.1 outer membrane efflux protein [Alteromonas mediterranea MED64]MBR9897033.1 TolC family protein [Gammaproteobacteria bacterium]